MNYFGTLLSVGLFLFSLSFFSCNELAEQSSPTESTTTAESPGGTAEMVALLQKIHSEIKPKTSYFDNFNQAKLNGEQVGKTKDLNKQMEFGIKSVTSMLCANINEPAITNMMKLLDVAYKANATDAQLNSMEKLLALAYIRLGEQVNCQTNTNDESCLMPIEGKGVYAISTAVEAAIQIYERVLQRDPTDKEAIWMLNFSYMALGKFPEGVPAKFRLSKDFFKSEAQIPKFKNIAVKLGLNTVALSGGVAVEDFDNDGFLDLMASSWGLDDQTHFFKNNGDGTFSDKTLEAGLIGLTGGLNMQHADYNNDGFVDVLILRGAWLDAEGQIPNSLLKNNGDGTFSDVTKSVGLFSKYPTQAAVWADFNLDGRLDIFIGNESLSKIKAPCELFIAQADGTFKNEIERSGLGAIRTMIKGVAAGDLDNDGFPDLYISILGGNNLLFKNEGKPQKVSFKLAATRETDKPRLSFPTWIWDYDNDGNLDIFAGAFGVESNEPVSSAQLATANSLGDRIGSEPKIYKNLGGMRFSDDSEKLGIKEGSFAMGSNFGDLDNDGFEDFYLGTGEPTLTAIVPNKMYKNRAGKQFLDVTTAGGFGHIQKGHAVGFGDFDNDGDQDVFCVLGGAYEGDTFGDALFLNPYGNQKNYLTLKLEGTTANRAAIGARIKIIAQKPNGKDLILHKIVSGGSSFGGNSLQQEIGLDDAIAVKKIEIIWPNAKQTKSVFTNIKINQFYLAKEGVSQLEVQDRKTLKFVN